jgi:Cu+-exporting ATPase
VEELEAQGCRTAMLGDGLNDAGALKASTVGVSVVDQVNTFTPASDVIMQASWIGKLDQLLDFAKDSKTILRASLVLSLLYNLGGLSFAVLGLLTPLIAAILMPLSSISVVLFVTGLSNIMAQKRGF